MEGPLALQCRPMRLGFGEILVILVIALLVFGPTKLPQLGEALGKGIRNFKKAQDGLYDDEQKPKAEALPSAAPANGSHSPQSAEATKV